MWAWKIVFTASTSDWAQGEYPTKKVLSKSTFLYGNGYFYLEICEIFTVDSRYCGHSRDRDFVSVFARVRNSGLREKS